MRHLRRQEFLLYSHLKLATKVALFISFFFLIACAPKRAPLPPGEIPAPKKITPQEEQFGHEILGELSQKYALDYDHPRRNEVDQIVAKITTAIGANSDPWHVNVFKDASEKNAAATKGNHIFVWTGIIDSTQNEDELAGILAHEISHVLLRHTEPTDGENFRNVLVQIGAYAAGTAASIALGGAGGDIAGKLASSATQQIGSGLLVYPYSREKEFEADIVGLYLVKKAGYDPHGIVNFWRRALNDPAFSHSIPFLSTHPPAEDRLVKLEEELRRVDSMHITVGKDPNPYPQFDPKANGPKTEKPMPTIGTAPTPTLPKDINQNKAEQPAPKNHEATIPKLPGVKVETPLPPDDSFDVSSDKKPKL